jgi:hypothetical protein
MIQRTFADGIERHLRYGQTSEDIFKLIGHKEHSFQLKTRNCCKFYLLRLPFLDALFCGAETNAQIEFAAFHPIAMSLTPKSLMSRFLTCG